MKQRIGIDVDGVLRDFCHGLTHAIKTHYPEYIKDTEIPEHYLKMNMMKQLNRVWMVV